ncbi:MAG: DUF5723 family protein [Bacteroidia bacterium]
MNSNFSKITVLLITSFTSLFQVESQTFIGLQHSNLGGIHQTGLNPANIANSRHRMYFNGVTAGFGFDNDYLKLSLPFPFLDLITGDVPSQYKNSNGGIAFNENWLTENVNNKSKNMNFYLQTRTPGFMISLPHDFALGIQYKNTISFQVNDVAEPLARLARYGIDSSSGSISYSGPNQFQVGETFGDNAFTVNMNAYGEIGLTIAKVLVKQDNFVLKAGVTPKMLMGYGSAYIKNRGVLIKAAGTDTIQFGETDIEYGYTDLSDLQDLNSINIGAIKNKILGSGFGYDVGVAFEYSPKALKNVTNNKNNYLFRGGISLLDAGRIKYKQNMTTTNIRNTTGDKIFVLSPAFADAWRVSTDRGLEYTDSTMRTIFDINSADQSTISKLPTTLNIQFDYNVAKIFYVGANLSQDLRGKKAIGSRRQSYLVVIPRLESRFVELSFPTGFMNDYKKVRVGMFLRLGPVFVGSDNLIGQLKSNNISGTDLYFGLSFGILKKKDKEETSSME